MKAARANGYTLVELLAFISLVTLPGDGLMVGARTGLSGAIVGLLIGFIFADLWFLALMKIWQKYSGTVGFPIWVCLLVCGMVVALPAATMLITQLLTHPSHA